jgi:glutamate synthase domain-containing protein 2
VKTVRFDYTHPYWRSGKTLSKAIVYKIFQYLKVTHNLNTIKMKRIILSIVALVFAVSVAFYGCNSPAQKVENAKDNVDQAKEDLDKANREYQAEIENFRKETAERMAINEQLIAALKVKIANEKYENKVLYNKKIEELEKKNRDMKKRADEFQDNGQDKWVSFKTEFNHDMDELGRALKDFFTDNKK